MKVTELLEAVKGAWKIQNLSGVTKTFKDEESIDARAWMKNRGDAKQVWNKAGYWQDNPRTVDRELNRDERERKQDERDAKRAEREREGKHLKQADYQKIYNTWMDAVGDSFPDGDPMDRMSRYLSKTFPEVSEYTRGDLIDLALKKCGHGFEKKGHNEYMTVTWESHALDVLHDINTLVEKGKTIGQAIDDADLADTFFYTDKGNLAMESNPWGKPDRSKYKVEWAKRYPKLTVSKV